MAAGLFISLEGIDGVGKSTQSDLLEEFLRSAGREVLRTFEPGGTELGQEIRHLLLHRKGDVAPRSEALLYAADRAHHVATKVRPALARGEAVITDRYLDSSVAYQGAGRALKAEDVRAISMFAVEGLLPDLTILLDLEASAAAAAEVSGLPLEKVYIHKMHAGGGFGRRGPHQDYTKQAVKIAKALPGTPVRLQWSREEDMRQGRYRPVSLVKLRGGLDKDGNWTGWQVKQSDQSIAITVYPHFVKDGIDQINTRVFRDNPYKVPNFTNEYVMREVHVPPGFWRAVAHTNNPFYRECFIDELAQAAGKDPYQFRRPLLEGTKDLAVLDAAAKAIGWDKPLAKGMHRGIAVVDSYGSFTAAAVELSVGKDKAVKVHRVAVAIDSGHVVHPDAVKAQIEGGVIWGLSAIMSEEITIENGAVKQGNFNDYPLARIAVAPEVIPVLVPSGGFWGGVGEPPIGGVMPAMVNALFSATGERIRSLPLKHHGFRYKT